MKQLIAILMSFQLMVVPVVFAQEKTDKPDKSAGDQFRENPEAKAKKGGDYFQMIIGTGTAIVGATMVTSCAIKYPSIMIFSAGSLIKVLSEIMGGKAHADYLRKKTADLKMTEEKLKAAGGGGEVQKQALEDALANEKEILNYINKKKKWASLVLLVYAAATAAAALEALNILAPPATCLPGTSLVAGKMMATGVAAAYSFLSGGMVQALLAGLGTYLIVGSAKITAMMNTAITRIAAFALTSIVQKTVISSLNAKAGVAKGNIEKLEKALADFNKNSTPTSGIATDTTGTGSADETGDGAIDPKTGKPIKTLPVVGKVNRLCAGNTAQGLEISEKSCGSPVRLIAPTFDASLQVPTLSSFSQGTVDVANQLANGDLDGAEIGAAGLTSQAGRINQIRDNAIKKLNDKLKADGKKGLDIDADVKTQLASMSGALKANDAGMSDALASLSSGNASLGTDLKGEADLKENIQKINETAKENKTGANDAAATAAVDTSLGSGIEDGLTADPNAVDPNAKKDETVAGIDEFELPNNDDVRQEKEASLFNIVSNRYILNYSKFFKKETPPTTPVEQKK